MAKMSRLHSLKAEKKIMAKDGQPHIWGAAIYDKPVDLGNSNISIKRKKKGVERQNKRDFPQKEKFDDWEVVNWVSITHIILNNNMFWVVWIYAPDYCKEGNFQVLVM